MCTTYACASLTHRYVLPGPQVVVIAAGYDTRAYRLGPAPGRPGATSTTSSQPSRPVAFYEVPVCLPLQRFLPASLKQLLSSGSPPAAFPATCPLLIWRQTDKLPNQPTNHLSTQVDLPGASSRKSQLVRKLGLVPPGVSGLSPYLDVRTQAPAHRAVELRPTAIS